MIDFLNITSQSPGKNSRNRYFSVEMLENSFDKISSGSIDTVICFKLLAQLDKILNVCIENYVKKTNKTFMNSLCFSNTSFISTPGGNNL